MIENNDAHICYNKGGKDKDQIRFRVNTDDAVMARNANIQRKMIQNVWEFLKIAY